MSTNSHDDTLNLALVGERDTLVRRLTRALGAIDRKRRAITHVVEDVAALVPRSSAPPDASSLSVPRNALVGAAAGGLVVALALLVQHRRQARRASAPRPRAWFAPPPAAPTRSLLSRLVRQAVGSLVMSIASAAARAILARALKAALEPRGLEILPRLPDVPEASFVRSPGFAEPTAFTADPSLTRHGVAALPPLRDFA